MFSHGQKRVKRSKELTEKENLINQKTEKVCQEFLHMRNTYKSTGKSLDELLEYSSGILEIMSDQPTVINFRQELSSQKFIKFEEDLKAIIEAKKDIEELTKFMDKVKSFVEKEMKFNSKLVMADLKSYQLWFYRLWLLKKYAIFERDAYKNNKEAFKPKESDPEKKLDIETEVKTESKVIEKKPETKSPANFAKTKSFKFIFKDLKMSEMFLLKDERNFHTWNYRFNLWNSLINIYPESRPMILESEREFVNKIHKKNYSNYSTIHFKMKLYQRLVDLGENLNETFLEELQKVFEGLFISPNEQALYLFQRWLFDQLMVKIILSIDKITEKSKKYIIIY